MLNNNDVLRARANIEALTGKKINGEISLKQSRNITVTKTQNGYEIGASSYTSLARALFSVLKAEQGYGELKVQQTAVFDDCGIMLDCSRNAVATTETVKELIRFISAAGMNLLMLYTEDTYEIPEEPYFGYMRGKYSLAELRELDAYAKSYGVELVPCIQTLSHLRTFLRFAGDDIRDTENTLLCREEKTYIFIENAVKAVRQAFSSNRIHIGMDEAYDIGTGEYMKKFGPQNGFDIMNEHLGRVTDICKKYGFTPMMWSDMYFHLASENNDYYDINAHLSGDIISKIPDCAMVYWDYFHFEKSFYEKMLNNHLETKKPVYFAGGISCWHGLLPRWDTAYKATAAGLGACVNTGIKTVFATMWGDDGNECNLKYDLPLILMYSEYMYNGADTTNEDINSAIRLLCGYGIEETAVLGALDIPLKSDAEKIEFTGKTLLYTDPFYQMGFNRQRLDFAKNHYEKLVAQIEQCGIKSEIFCFAHLIYSTLINKINLMNGLNCAYANKNKCELKKIAESDLPTLIENYAKLAKMHKSMWMQTYKPFGYEHHAYRYGGVIQRLNDIKQTVEDYVCGKISVIAELEEARLDTSNRYGFAEVTSPGVGI